MFDVRIRVRFSPPPIFTSRFIRQTEPLRSESACRSIRVAHPSIPKLAYCPLTLVVVYLFSSAAESLGALPRHVPRGDGGRLFDLLGAGGK